MTELTISCGHERIDSIGGVKIPDPEWFFVDNDGHRHEWVDGVITTLDVFPAGETNGWIYSCKICGDEADPGYILTLNPVHVAGITTYAIDGVNVTRGEYMAMGEKLVKEQMDVL